MRWAGPEVLHVGFNHHGRDWLVGDTHGYRSLLREHMERQGFDVRYDRLFSTGDLIDRGTEPLACLQLLDEPWFYAILGNHERMMLARLRARASGPLTRWQAHLYANKWDRDFSEAERRELNRLLDKVCTLPLTMRVDALMPFWVIHAQRPAPHGRIWTDDQMGVPGALASKIESITWSRRIAKKALHSIQNQGPSDHIWSLMLNPEGTVPPIADVLIDGVAPLWEPGVSLTYTGHTIVPRPILHRSHLLIDGGPYKDGGGLNVLRHDHVVTALANHLPSLPIVGV